MVFNKTSNKTKKNFPNKRKQNSTPTMVNKSSLRDHTIVAARFLTKMSASFQGTANTSALSATPRFALAGNSLPTPFQSSALITTSGGFTATGNSSVSTNPMGYSSLSGLYRSYRVNGSRIKITLQPTAAADNFNLVVIPITAYQSAPYSSQIMNNQYARTKVCTVNNNVKENTIIHYMPTTKVLGYTYQQWQDQLPTIVSSSPPTTLDWFWEIALDQISGSANTSPVNIVVEIDLYVEFSDPIFQAG